MKISHDSNICRKNVTDGAGRLRYILVAGDFKLAYAQFEELATFVRFGARLDEDSCKIIEHGRRIRACLKQPEFAPVSAPAQIAVLPALTVELFDRGPLYQMTDAKRSPSSSPSRNPRRSSVTRAL